MKMIEIISSDQLLSSFLPINSKQTGIRWIFSKFNIIIPYDNSVLIYNSLSKCFVKTPLSFANIIKRNSIEYKDLLSEDFDILTNNGFLIPEQTDELKTYIEINDLVRTINSSEKGVKRYNILTTTGCNIRCFYCFEGEIEPISMTCDTAEHVAEYIIRTRDSNSETNLRWFGGEPLVNNKVIDIITQKLRDNNIPFVSTMSSNGILFSDQIIRKSRDLWNLKKVRTSFDGLEKEHNKRKNCLSLNAFKVTSQNIEKLICAGIQVDIRFTLDLDNSDELLELAHLLCDKYSNNSLVKMYSRCIFQETTTDAADKDYERVKRCVEKKEELDSYLRSRGVFDYNRLLPVGYQPYYCAANDPQAVVISPNGNLCSCETIDASSTFWGSVLNDNYDEAERDAWLRHDIINPECQSCKFLPSCTPFAKNKCKNDYYNCVGRAENCYRLYLIHKYNIWKQEIKS